ncbi:MAG: DUF4291 family protein, partial [Verrucomicrobiota bacterium]
LSASDVRLQWDPDHSPTGAPEERRAIQLGLRGDILGRYARDEVVSIEDISSFVAEQREILPHRSEELLTPREEVYLPERNDAWRNVGLQPVKPQRLPEDE